ARRLPPVGGPGPRPARGPQVRHHPRPGEPAQIGAEVVAVQHEQGRPPRPRAPTAGRNRHQPQPRTVDRSRTHVDGTEPGREHLVEQHTEAEDPAVEADRLLQISDGHGEPTDTGHGSSGETAVQENARVGESGDTPPPVHDGGRAAPTRPARPTIPAQGMRLATHEDTTCSGHSNGPRRLTTRRHRVANSSAPTRTVRLSHSETKDSGVPSSMLFSSSQITRMCPT